MASYIAPGRMAVCHGSDSVENGLKEIALWFPEGLAQYTRQDAGNGEYSPSMRARDPRSCAYEDACDLSGAPSLGPCTDAVVSLPSLQPVYE